MRMPKGHTSSFFWEQNFVPNFQILFVWTAFKGLCLVLELLKCQVVSKKDFRPLAPCPSSHDMQLELQSGGQTSVQE